MLDHLFEFQQRFGDPPPEELFPDVMRLQGELTVACLLSLAILDGSQNRDQLFALCKKLLMLIFDYQAWQDLAG